VKKAGFDLREEPTGTSGLNAKPTTSGSSCPNSQQAIAEGNNRRREQRMKVQARLHQVGFDVVPPVPIEQVQSVTIPNQTAQSSGKPKVEGTVIVAMTVAINGEVQDVRVVRSPDALLDQKAIEAVKQWKFSPARKNGLPVPVQVNVEINFQLYWATPGVAVATIMAINFNFTQNTSAWQGFWALSPVLSNCRLRSTLHGMAHPAGTLKSVAYWTLPNYVAIVYLIAFASASSIPLRVQHTVEGVWMFAALFLPISTIFAVVKAVHLSLRARDETEVRIWQSIVGWCLVAVAIAFNLFSYVVIARTLRWPKLVRRGTSDKAW
jgi:TonB family protein